MPSSPRSARPLRSGRRRRCRDGAARRRARRRAVPRGRPRRGRSGARGRARRPRRGRPHARDGSGRGPRFLGCPERREALKRRRCGREPRPTRARDLPTRRRAPSRGDRMRLKSVPPAQDPAMYEPGLDRHERESEWQTLEDDLRTDPAQALPELDRLVARMLADSGYELTDPVVGEGEEREIVVEYLAAHEIVEAAERDPDDISPGDFASAINGYPAVFDPPVATPPTARPGPRR